MSVYSEKVYGSFLYGPDPASISTVSPDTGPSIGGQSIIVEGVGFDPRQWDDLFDGLILDVAKWTDISGGGGSVSTGASRLQLTTGVVAGGVAGVSSAASWVNCQLEVRAILPSVTIPVGTVIPLAFQLRIDANNYAMMFVELSNTGAYTLNCDVHRGGVSVGAYTQTCSRGTLNLRILRWGRTVYFIFNGTIIYTNSNFVATAATARMYSSNLAINYDALATVEWFYWRTFITLDNQLIYAPTVVSNSRVRGFTPPSINDKDVSAAYAGLVDVSIIANGTDTSTDAYEYYFTDRLRIMNLRQFGIKLSIIDDDQLITKSSESKGL